jgi:hypothetical protein
MSYIKHCDLPKERKVKINHKNNCIQSKNINFIHDYKKFDKLIIQPFQAIIKPEIREQFINTCNHMFKNVGYGVFVFILNGKIHTYQLFANTTEIKPGTQTITKRHIKKNNKTRRKKGGKTIGKPISDIKKMGVNYFKFKAYDNWWKAETDRTIYYDLLQKCLKGKNITTCFFLNLNTHPVLFKKKCQQYVLHQDICKNNNLEKNKYIPVLSGCTTKNHYDKCIVYPDAWEVITRKKFGMLCTNNFMGSFDKINTDWSTKTETLMFRGANKTCYQFDEDRNERIKVLKILNDIQNHRKINININAGLINSSIHDDSIDNNQNNGDTSKILKSIGVHNFSENIPMYQQSNCKYILDIDGHANPWRLCFELSYNSCIILFLSDYVSWFYDSLKHMKNVYIINVNSPTLEKDLYDCLTLLGKNDKIGKKIAEGAVDLYNNIINFNYIQKYMVSLLSEPEFDILLPIH